jgi:hypothetical protein
MRSCLLVKLQKFPHPMMKQRWVFSAHSPTPTRSSAPIRSSAWEVQPHSLAPIRSSASIRSQPREVQPHSPALIRSSAPIRSQPLEVQSHSPVPIRSSAPIRSQPLEVQPHSPVPIRSVATCRCLTSHPPSLLCLCLLHQYVQAPVFNMALGSLRYIQMGLYVMVFLLFLVSQIILMRHWVTHDGSLQWIRNIMLFSKIILGTWF